MSKTYLQLQNNAKPAALLQAETACTFWQRFRGLMLRSPLPPGHALLLAPCASVHMCWMRFALDIVYLDKDWKILKIVPGLRPWLGLSACPGAWGVLEMTAGEAERLGLAPGQILHSINNRQESGRIG